MDNHYERTNIGFSLFKQKKGMYFISTSGHIILRCSKPLGRQDTCFIFSRYEEKRNNDFFAYSGILPKTKEFSIPRSVSQTKFAIRRKDDSCKFRKKAGCERKQTKRTYSCSAIVDKIKCSFHNSLNVNEFNRQPTKD